MLGNKENKEQIIKQKFLCIESAQCSDKRWWS